MNDTPITLSRADSSPPRSRSATWLSLGIGALVTLVALYLIVRSVNFELTLLAIRSANLWLVLAALGVQLAAMLFVIRRWQILLRPYPTRYNELTQIYFSTHLLNTVLPAKMGTLARILLAAEMENLNVGFVFGSIAIEKVLDTLVMLLLLAVIAPFVPMPEWLRETVTASVLLVLLLLLLLVSVARFRSALLNAVTRFETRLFGAQSTRLALLVRGVIESLMNLTRRRELASVLFWTVCAILAGGLVNQLLFAALDISVPWSATWFVMVVLQIGTRVPALPANLGVFHYVVILALSVYSVNENTALAYAILLHLVVFVLPALIGALCALPISARLFALLTNRTQPTTE